MKKDFEEKIVKAGKLRTELYLGIFNNPPDDERYKLVVPNSIREVKELLKISGINASYDIENVKNGNLYFATIYDSKNGNVPVKFLMIYMKNNSFCHHTESTMWTDISESVPDEVENKFIKYMMSQILSFKELKNNINR